MLELGRHRCQGAGWWWCNPCATPPAPSALAALLGPHAQEASFKEFLSRPENQALVEEHQKKEAKQAIQLQEKMQMLEFRDKVCGGGRSGVGTRRRGREWPTPPPPPPPSLWLGAGHGGRV